MKLGVSKVVIASSETTYGVCFAEGDKDFTASRLKRIMTSIRWTAMALQSGQRKDARAFAMRYGADIYALRIGNVIEPDE